MRLVIGIPARNEAGTLGALVDRLQPAGDRLPGWDVELALAYQASSDDTLQAWFAAPSRLPRTLLRCPPNLVGKGQNTRLLLEHAAGRDADYLLLVDADLRDYAVDNLVRFLAAARRHRHALVLPLWSRAHGQGNTTNYLAVPLLDAVYGSRIRHPLAGHALLHRSLYQRLGRDELPPGYGVDIAVVMAALTGGWRIGQVAFTGLSHGAGNGTSASVLSEVAASALARIAAVPPVDRSDVRWPPGYWRQPTWSPPPGQPRDFAGLLACHAGGEREARYWRRWVDADLPAVRDLWCDHLGEAVTAVVDGDDPGAAAERLVCPFLVHAWHHAAHPPPSVEAAETYVAGLGSHVARRLPPQLGMVS